MASVACGGGQIRNLQLRWQGVEGHVSPSPTVSDALAAVPVAFAIRDMRPDPTVVGRYEEDGFVVHTTDNVAQYCSDHFAEMLRAAGARLAETPVAILAADLVDYQVDEGGSFVGTVRIRLTIHRNGVPDWTKNYEGSSKRWGRTHNPENFNEALSNALAEVANNILRDEEFGRILLSPVAAPGGPAAPGDPIPSGPPSGG
jgi:uncharacterized lipoprotein YajG